MLAFVCTAAYMKNKDTVLVVDDSAINREILSRILSDEFIVLEADNGKTALEAVIANKGSLSAILLDLVMPVMDGCEFLSEFHKLPKISDIPVLVSTVKSDKKSETEALKLGAWDFITKPFDADIIRFRLRGAIERSQVSALKMLRYQSQYDMLTGIYNKNMFFSETHKMLEKYPNEHFAFFRFDINNFHLINSFYGLSVGDELLKYIAAELKNKLDSYELPSTYGRIEADVFAFCRQYTDRESINRTLQYCCSVLKKYDISFDIVPAFGIYIIEDNHDPVDEIYDKANLASKKSKGNYYENYEIYSEDMGRAVSEEQDIINEMTLAVKSEQFKIYYQPKYDIRTDKPCGAEALVRWKDREKDLFPRQNSFPFLNITALSHSLIFMFGSTSADSSECGLTAAEILILFRLMFRE